MSMGSSYLYPQENPQMILAKDDLCFMVVRTYVIHTYIRTYMYVCYVCTYRYIYLGNI